MAAYQKRLRNHLCVASWEEAFVTPEPVCSSPRLGNDNLYKPEKSLTGCFFPPKALNHFLAHILTGIMDLSETLTLSSCPRVPSWHITMLLFLQNAPTYRILHSLTAGGGGRSSLLLSVFLWCPVDPGFKTCSRRSWGHREGPP